MEHHPPTPVLSFVETHCFDCHQGEDAEAGLDLESIDVDLSNNTTAKRWVRIFDRVRDGEMPPQDYATADKEDVDNFLRATGAWLRSSERAEHRELGRVRGRRLTRKQVERSLQDLLGIDIPLADQLPEETRSHRFTTVADGQAVSHFQMQQHLAVVDLALDEAFRRARTVQDHYEREFDAVGLARRNPKRRCREPEMRNGQAVIWNGGVIFYGRLPATTAPQDGWYRFAVDVSAVKPPENGGVWSTIRSGLCVSSAPLLTHIKSFEANEKPKTIQFEAWLRKGHMLEIRPGDATLKKGRFKGGQIGAGEGEPQDIPGIAFDRLTMTRFHPGADDDEVRRLLFGGLDVTAEGDTFDVVSESPRKDAERLLVAFARRAFRQPVDSAVIAPYVESVASALDRGHSFKEALRLGYRALLCSPRFLFFTESSGQLTNHAVAARLSYFLTGSTPDNQLSQLAESESPLDMTILHKETDRLLAGSGGRQFVEDFAAEWLDLDAMNASVPDRKMYPKFDPVVQQSMLDETHAYLHALLVENQSVVRLIDSDFIYLNSRLARYYGVEGVQGDELRRITLPPDSHRGGVLTQGAILKVTANGSTTSPVLRGVWVSERLLGIPIPPPPTNVPAIEPDIRGATTIREQLAKHRSEDSCASCHVKIDPPGFALENFDPAGQWRDKYTKKSGGRKRRGVKVDASYELPDGRTFQDIREFRRLVATEPKKLAASVAENLLVYGTGAPIKFSDRDAVDTIVDEAAKHDFGFRSIVHSVVTSPIFLNK